MTSLGARWPVVLGVQRLTVVAGVVANCMSMPSHKTIVFIGSQWFVLKPDCAKPWPTKWRWIFVTLNQVPRTDLLQLRHLQALLLVNREEVFDLFSFSVNQATHWFACDDLCHLSYKRHQRIDELHLEETLLL